MTAAMTETAVGDRLYALRVILAILGGRMQQAMRDFFEALVTKESAAQHQERRDDPREHGAQDQCCGHHDELVERRPLEHCPHDREFALGAHAGDLLGVEREVVAQDTSRFPGRDLRHDRHVIEQRGNIIEQGQQAASGHNGFRRCC